MRSARCAGLLVFLLATCLVAPVAAQDDPSASAAPGSTEAVSQSGGSPDGAAVTPSSDLSAAEGEGAEPEIEVEVVGKREGLLSISPAPGEQVIEVTAEAIADTAATTVLEAIDLTPSVFVRHQGARYENRLSIRGAAPRLVLLDGIPIAREGYSGPGGGAGGAESSFAGRILYTMPAEMIERIDVIRSAGTIVYGQTAAAGAVINIVTKDPKVGSQVSATAEYGSFERERYLLDAGVNDGRLGFYVLGSSEYAGSNLPLGEKRFANAFGKVFYSYPDGSRLLLDFFSLDGRRVLDLSQDFTIVPARYWRIDPWKEQFANVVYSQALSREATLDYVFYQRERDFTTNQFTSATFSKVNTNWLESQDDAGFDLRYSIRRDSGRITRLGVQWADVSSDTLQTQYVGPSGPLPKPKVTAVSQDRTTKSAFLNETAPLRANVRASVGARLDDMDDFSPDLSFAAGLEATVSSRTMWYLNAGTGVEHPDPTAGDVDKGIVPPEANSLSLETGWSVQPTSVSRWTAALFWTRTRDARVLYNDPPGSIGPLAFISKPEDLKTWGVELAYDGKINERLRWFANYTYLVEDLSNSNRPAIPGPLYPNAPEPPRHLGAAGIRGEMGNTRIAMSAKHASDHFEQNRLMKTAFPADSFLVLDLKLSRRIGSGELSLFIDNLLDTDYETMPAFPRPGRNYLVSYRFPL